MAQRCEALGVRREPPSPRLWRLKGVRFCPPTSSDVADFVGRSPKPSDFYRKLRFLTGEGGAQKKKEWDVRCEVRLRAQASEEEGVRSEAHGGARGMVQGARG
jgi:hypothetical protein